MTVRSLTKTRDTIYDNDDLDDVIFFGSVFSFVCSSFRSFEHFQKIGRVDATILVQKLVKNPSYPRVFLVV